MKPVIIISTYPNKKSLTKTANQLVKNRLVACVNLIKISSIYTWKGKIENSPEYMAFFKTTLKNKNKLIEKIRITHPYKVPEIVQIDIRSVNKPYLQWIRDSTH